MGHRALPGFVEWQVGRRVPTPPRRDGGIAPYRITYRTRGEWVSQWQATFSHLLRVMSANPIPKGGEAFRGVESDGASHLAANRSGSGASEEFVFCRRKRRLVRNQ